MIQPPPMAPYDENWVLGIPDPNDLFNGATDMDPTLAPLSWHNRSFQLRLGWLEKEAAALGVKTGWVTSIQAHVPGDRQYAPSVLRVAGPLGFVDIDARKIMRAPELALYDVEVLTAGKTPSRKTYPGDDAVKPKTKNPIGEAWPTHSIQAANPGRLIFRPSADDNITDFPVSVEVLRYFKTAEGRYRKFITKVDAQGPLPGMGKPGYAWEFEPVVEATSLSY